MSHVALYAGTFDPVHNGHVDIARRSAELFERVVVGVVDRPSKPLLFSQEERVALFQEAVADVPNLSVVGYAGLTVEQAARCGAVAIVRGLRAAPDFEYEHQIASMNRHLRPGLDTVFLITAPRHSHLSASLLKEVAALGGDVSAFVPPHVAAALAAKLGASATG